MKEAFKKLDYPLLIVTLVLTAFGLVMILSASNVTAVLQYHKSEYYFLVKQLIVVGISIIPTLFILVFPTRKYNLLSLAGIAFAIVMLIALKTYGTVTNSAQSWFRIFGISIQPSEIAKTLIILYLACWYGSQKKFNTYVSLFGPLVPPIIIFALVAIEPDLGTAAIIAIICMFIFLTLPFEKNKVLTRLKLLIVVAAIGGGIFLYTNQNFLTSTQASRFTFQNPCDRYLEETGYQVCNGYIAINNGGLGGVGLGKSTQKYLYLPEAHTDFIFPIIVEETGLIGGGIVIGLYIVLLFRILIIARNARDLRGSIIAFGTFAYILTHIIVNLGGVLALIPLTGVPLPFLSYGGTFCLNLLVLIALTQRVAIEAKEPKVKSKNIKTKKINTRKKSVVHE